MARMRQQPPTAPPPPAPVPAEAMATSVVCPACGAVHATDATHDCDPAMLWRRAVARWNARSGDEQRAHLAECRRDGHDDRPVPLPGMVMCWRCCTYRVVEET